MRHIYLLFLVFFFAFAGVAKLQAANFSANGNSSLIVKKNTPHVYLPVFTTAKEKLPKNFLDDEAGTQELQKALSPNMLHKLQTGSLFTLAIHGCAHEQIISSKLQAAVFQSDIHPEITSILYANHFFW